MSRNRYKHRPLYLRATNFLGGAASLGKSVSLDPDKLIATARQRAKHSDFGTMNWRTGFEKLCMALEDEAKLHLVGRLSARSHLLQLLSNRLLIHAARDERVSAQTIAAPVIITGLPRSGSTLLHGLLAQDPAVRVPWTWEVMLPCSSSGTDARQRIRQTDRMLRWVDRLAPRFRTVHPIGAELPQECIAITAHAFASLEFHTTFNVPSYQRWLDDQDGREAIGYHHRFLQHLGACGKSGRWVLKAPAHLATLPALAETYPDARFVFTRRAPEQVAASIASHGVILRCAFSDEVDVASVADFWMGWWARTWRRARQFKSSHDVLDLQYQDLIANPIDCVRQLYANLDLSLSNTAEQRMQAFLSANPKDKFGRHHYTLDEFGLDKAAIHNAFGA